jgi:DNA mismatch repair ATPase MutS
MKHQISKTLSHFHNEYPESVILFKYGNRFVAYQDDAKHIAKPLNLTLEQSDGVAMVIIPVDSYIVSMQAITSDGTKVVTITHASQMYSLPDIDVLKAERDYDY